MQKNVVRISMIAGVLILGVCARIFAGGRHVDELPTADIEHEEERVSIDEGGKPEQEIETQNKTAVPEKIRFDQPVVSLNGEEGKLSYRWGHDFILIDDRTILFSGFGSAALSQKEGTQKEGKGTRDGRDI